MKNLREKVMKHVGHPLACISYGGQDVSIRCEYCNEVLYSAETEEESVKVWQEGKVYERPNRFTNLRDIYYGSVIYWDMKALVVVNEKGEKIPYIDEKKEQYEVISLKRTAEVGIYEAMVDTTEKPTQVVYGDYVLSPCKNAFNDKVSYWISKKGYSVAYYAFTPLDDEDLKRQLEENSIEGYIRMYEEMGEY